MKITGSVTHIIYHSDETGYSVISIEPDEGQNPPNGDLGTIMGETDKHLIINLAYACTIHKSQGSEYSIVVVAATMQHAFMWQRNLLYTAITRAKQVVVLVGARHAVRLAVNNNREQHRYTSLAERLKE